MSLYKRGTVIVMMALGLFVGACERTPRGVLLTVAGTVSDENGNPVSLRIEPFHHRAELCYRVFLANGETTSDCGDIESLQDGRFKTQVEYNALGERVTGVEVKLNVKWTVGVGKGYSFRSYTAIGRRLENAPAGADAAAEFTLPTYFHSAYTERD